MHGGVHADFGLEHTADHALHAVDLGGGGDPQRVVETAALHELNVDQVRRAHLHNRHRVLGGEYAFIRHDRDVGALGHVAQALKVAALDRLLDELNVKATFLHLVEELNRLLGGPRLVRVDAQADIGAGSLAHGGKARDVKRRVDADLDLERVVAAGDGGQGVARHLFRVVDADGDVGGDLLSARAEELIDRRAQHLAVQVVQRDIHRGLGAGVVDDGSVQQLHQRLKAVDFLPP